MMATSEVFTGERFMPGCSGEIWAEHWHRYLFARQFVAGKDVLDAACGEGYGSAWLARAARKVSGLDVDAPTVAAARAKYGGPSLQFDVGSVAAMPYADASFDYAISFETLEHLAEQEAMLREFRRVLRPDGVLIISTPNKAEYSDKRHFQNAFHVHELYEDDFRALLGRHFAAQRWLGQKLTFNSALWPWPPASSLPPPCEWIQPEGVDAQAITPPMYFIAFVAARESLLPSVQTMTLLADPTETMYDEYVNTVERASALERLVVERERQLGRRNAQMEHAENLLAQREAVVSERDGQLSAMARRAADMEALIVQREGIIIERDRELSEVVAQTTRREQIIAERDRQLAAMAARSAEMETLIAERERVIVERDAQLADGNARTSRAESLVAERERIIVERDGQLEQFTARMAIAEKLIAERERIIVERDAQLASFAARIAALEGTVAAQAGELEQRVEQLAAHERELAHRAAQVAVQVAVLEAEVTRRGGWGFWLAQPYTRLRRLLAARDPGPSKP